MCFGMRTVPEKLSWRGSKRGGICHGVTDISEAISENFRPHLCSHSDKVLGMTLDRKEVMLGMKSPSKERSHIELSSSAIKPKVMFRKMSGMDKVYEGRRVMRSPARILGVIFTVRSAEVVIRVNRLGIISMS